MFFLITGGSGSGKSEYAEELIQRSGLERKFYIATMEIWGEEGQRKVERHKRLRAGKGFITIECPRELDKISLASSAFPEEEAVVRWAVLVECISNLAANELFGCLKPLDYQAALERMKRGILHLRESSGLLVVVTNEIFSDGIRYEPETERYIRLLGEMNYWMAKEAEQVIEVVCGLGVEMK